MRVCRLTPPIPNPADVIQVDCSHQMPAVGGHSQLVMWNLIVVSCPCNIYAKENYGIYFWIVGASKGFEVSTTKSGQFIRLLNFLYQFWYYFNVKDAFCLPWNGTAFPLTCRSNATSTHISCRGSESDRCSCHLVSNYFLLLNIIKILRSITHWTL